MVYAHEAQSVGMVDWSRSLGSGQKSERDSKIVAEVLMKFGSDHYVLL